MKIRLKIKRYCLLAGLLASGCGAMTEGPTKKTPANLIATPASYYSTAKARYLGSKYKDNLDRLTARIVRNPGTTQLQFANNISSVGGIGFFTHSATKTADERYLEVVLATPETFESKGDYSEKVHRLFSRYGQDLLSILAGDTEIFHDKELAGYGLNLNWRTVIAVGPANRVSLARAIVYFHKERVAGFLRRSISQNELLSDAVIFAVEDDGALQLVSYQPRETKPDLRPAIREDDLIAGSPAKAAPGAPLEEKAKRSVQEPVAKVEPPEKEEPLAQEASKRASSEKEISAALPSEQPLVLDRASMPGVVKSAPAAEKRAAPNLVREPETIALSRPPVEAESVKPVPQVVLPKAPPQKIIIPAAEKEAPTLQKKAPSDSKAEPMKLPTDTPKEQRNFPIIVKAPETKSGPTPSGEETEVKTPAPAATPKPTSKSPIHKPESTKKPEVAAGATAPEPSTRTIERSVATVPPVVVEPETRKLAVDPPAPKKPATVAEAVVKSPVMEMKPASSPERLATQTAPTAKLPALTMPTPAGETTARSPAAATKPSGVSARADVPTVPPARMPEPLSAAPAANVAKNPATETKVSTSPTRVEASPTPGAKMAETPALGPVVQKLAKSPMVETKQSSSPARVETSTAPTAKWPGEPSGAPAVKEVAKSPVVETKPASSSAPAESPTVPSGHVPARPLAAGDNLKAPLERAKMDQKRRDAKQPVTNNPVEPALAMPAQPSEAIRPAPTSATALPPIPRAEIKPTEQEAVGLPSMEPAQAVNPLRPRDTGSAPAIAKNEVPEPITRAFPVAPKGGLPEKLSSPAAGEQLALLKKPVEPVIERAPVARPTPRPLQGFIIQVAFQDKQKAQSWAEKMMQRGYVVSVTEAGPEGSLRVRLGNFAVRDEAERQLQTFKQEGMSGIIINLPQAFRPEAVSSIP